MKLYNCKKRPLARGLVNPYNACLKAIMKFEMICDE